MIEKVKTKKSNRFSLKRFIITLAPTFLFILLLLWAYYSVIPEIFSYFSYTIILGLILAIQLNLLKVNKFIYTFTITLLLFLIFIIYFWIMKCVNDINCMWGFPVITLIFFIYTIFLYASTFFLNQWSIKYDK